MALTTVNAQMVSGAITTSSTGNVSIGSTTVSSNLSVYGAGSGTFSPYNDPLVVQGSDYSLLYVKGTNGISASVYSYNASNGWYTGTNNSASYRIGYMSSINSTGITNAKDGSAGITIDTSGYVGIGNSSPGSVPARLVVSQGGNIAYFQQNAAGGYCGQFDATVNGGTYYFVNFLKAGVGISNITSNGTTISYNTGSDYRLKDNIEPITNALETVAKLKPSKWNWKEFWGGGSSQGFVAHELAKVVPDCVTGEKDAVDEEGNPIYQGVDTSFLVATLTAAIQELKAELDATKAEVAALKAAP